MEANEPNAIRIYYVAREHLKERPAGLTNPVRVHTLFHLAGHVEPSAEDAAALRAYLLTAANAEENMQTNVQQPLVSFEAWQGFIDHLERQREFSSRTFGPGPRIDGVCDHIAKELTEVRESDGALAEWVDVILLALDGAWRSGASPHQIIVAMRAKQARNENRNWPDWRTVDQGKAIEHVRESEPVTRP